MRHQIGIHRESRANTSNSLTVHDNSAHCHEEPPAPNRVRRRTRAAAGFVTVPRFMIVVLLLMGALASAQDVTEPSLKAAYIFHFLKFTEWPADVLAPADSFLVCVLGDTAVGEALERNIKARLVAGHAIAVAYVTASRTSRPCHVLYMSGVPAVQAARFVAEVRDMPVLTVSDIEGFTERGGIARLFFDHGQLRFIIRNDFAKRARLQISAKLLLLAKPE